MKKYYIFVIGCQMNKSDSERISAYLSDLGWARTEDSKTADLVILVTCGVRQSAEDRIYGFVPKFKRENPKAKIMVTGCLARRQDVVDRLNGSVDIWLPIDELPSLGEKLEPGAVIKSYKEYLDIRPRYESDFSAFVPIGNGCNNFCTYCVVPHARGREVYRAVDEIYEEVRGLVEKGYKEIILIAQNVNSYKHKLKNHKFAKDFGFEDEAEIAFPELLRLMNRIPGDFWIRFATSHPKDMSKELIEAISECEKVCHHIHLPAQAGDDEVLRQMNRRYSRKHYIGLVEKIRNVLNNQKKRKKKHSLDINFRGMKYAVPLNDLEDWYPPVSITTDIIVGFPGESVKQFENTLAMFEEIKYDMAYVAQYSPRPGTLAEKMPDDVDRAEKKRREEALMAVLRRTSLENNRAYIGKTVRVLAEAINKEGWLIGKTETGKVVKVGGPKIVEQGSALAGHFVRVKINEVEDFGMKGELV